MIFAVPGLDRLSPDLIRLKLEGIQDNTFCIQSIVSALYRHF